mmetsp:Transcript_3128/g.5502  ORF Transcript_3128/g.5502 Transcript_3128/m.5502 type:complete len:165 (-) Transcript_3128:107-601(-)|eukprot:CAMPEP_0182450150 /NCGR_PEP_ID=MMETSP1172-20130603/39212_1 /TAXON_ID=708627 /ORGANISM="Timspurckia oligopyrenoides, Strain CCMP3278" /LENGTH=164 /DNA_ID=CAMNT_0024647659 /DNA_START=83 /DNA_END=577 /DNA_ORIENTATION=-
MSDSDEDKLRSKTEQNKYDDSNEEEDDYDERRVSDPGAGTLESKMTFVKRFEDDDGSRSNIVKENFEIYRPVLSAKSEDDPMKSSNPNDARASFGHSFRRSAQNSFSELQKENSRAQQERIMLNSQESRSERQQARIMSRKKALAAGHNVSKEKLKLSAFFSKK